MENKKTILIAGADGYIGSNLRQKLQNDNNYDIYASTLNQSKKEKTYKLDITSAKAVLDIVKKVHPEIIIHTVGISSLAQCEEDQKNAQRVNIDGTKNLIRAIEKVNPNIKLVFMSSDYIFDGEKGNYKESDITNPKTYYGKTKAISENDIQNELKNYIICRTANVYGRGGNFFNFLLECLKQNKTVDIFDDVFYTPTYIDYLTDSIEKLINQDYRGIIHIAGKKKISRYNFAVQVAQVMGKDKSLIKRCKQPLDGPIAQDSSLNTEYSRQILGNSCPSVKESLHYLFGNLISPYFSFTDGRGKLTGIMQGEKWEEINYIESLKGCIRGNHYHKKTKEGFYIIDGRIKVSLLDINTNLKKDFIAKKGDIFVIKPNTLHTFKVLGDSRWVNMLSKAMNKDSKDICKIS